LLEVKCCSGNIPWRLNIEHQAANFSKWLPAISGGVEYNLPFPCMPELDEKVAKSLKLCSVY